MIAISILGPVAVTVGDDERRVPPGKSRELLVRLALDAGVEVRTDRLIDDLWGEESAERNTVQSKVSMLRRALGGAVVISGSRSGYTLEVDPTDVDAIDVLNRLESAQALLSSGDASGAFDSATAALARFHGDELADAGDGPWLEPHRIRLEEAHVALLETKFGAAVDIAPPGSIVAELEDLVRQYPLRERLWELLMTALYRAQRQADALEAYRRIAAILDQELGLSPGPRLRELEQMVLKQDAALDRSPPAQAVPAPVPRGNLPTLTSDLHQPPSITCQHGGYSQGDGVLPLPGSCQDLRLSGRVAAHDSKQGVIEVRIHGSTISPNADGALTAASRPAVVRCQRCIRASRQDL